MSLGSKLRGAAPPSLLFAAFAFTIAGKLSAFLKDVVLSYFFGVGIETDAYFIANLIPGLIWASILVTIATVFLPLYVEQRARSVSAADRFANEAVQVYLIAALLLTTVCIVAAEPIVRISASDASADTVELARKLTIIMSLGFIFTGYVGVQNAIQQANGRFLAPLLVPVANHSVTMVGIVIAAYYDDIAIAVVAAVLAWALQAPLQRIQTRRFYRTRSRWLARRRTAQRLTLLSAPIMLGVFLDQVNIYVGVALAGTLGPGAISHLSYASRLALFLGSVFAWLVSYLLFPRLARGASHGDDGEVARTLMIGTFLIVGSTTPAVVVGFILREPLVEFVFGRGAFDAADVHQTALVFGFYAYGIVFLALREIFNRVFFSYHKMSVPLFIGIVSATTNLGVSWLLMRVVGVAGVAIGASVAAVVYVAGQLLILALWKPELLHTNLTKSIFAILAAATAGALALSYSVRILPQMSALPTLIVGSAVAIAAYAGMLALTGRLFRFSWRDAQQFIDSSSRHPGQKSSD